MAVTCGYGEELSGSINAGNFLNSCKIMVIYEITDIMKTKNQGGCKIIVLFCRMFEVNITEELDSGNQ